MAPPSDVERFRADLHRLGAGEGRLALAVSGGADSMAMLLLAAAALPGQVIAATFDHRLRDGSAGDAALVAQTCARLRVPHATLAADAPIAGASLQAQARAARYAALAEWAIGEGAAALATAHHADDQAETFLMRAVRGAGLGGLAGIRERTTIAGVVVVRPLLGWRRAELAAIVEAAGIATVDDPANADPRHDRTRFRALLAANPALDAGGLAEAASHLGTLDAELGAAAERHWVERAVLGPDTVEIDIADLPRELRRRLARRAISRVRADHAIDEPSWDEGMTVEPLLDALEAGGAATRAGVLARADGTRWRLAPAPPRRARRPSQAAICSIAINPRPPTLVDVKGNR